PPLGGTCLSVGCIPSKALLDSSEHFAYARHRLAGHGIKASVELDLGAMMKRKEQVVRDLTRGVEGLFAKNRVTWTKGTARLLSAGEIEVGGASGKAARVTGHKVVVTVAEGDGTRDQECDVLLVAVGRRPYADGLGARELGVRFDERGRITVDESYETSVPGVYAIGDVIPGPMLAHKAEEEGIAAVERMAGQAGHVDYACVPSVVYTWPELASVGFSEEEAAQRGWEVAVGTFPFLANGRARAMDEREGQVKIVADARTDRIVSAHILGPRASDLI